MDGQRKCSAGSGGVEAGNGSVEGAPQRDEWRERGPRVTEERNGCSMGEGRSG